MRIRSAALSDIPTLVSLNHEAQEAHANAFPQRFRRDAPLDVVSKAFSDMVAAPSSFWLVAEDERPIGFLSAEFREREESWCIVAHHVCYLAGIVVAPGFRRRGVARALVAELVREAERRGVAHIELDVWSFNTTAKKTFAKLGFRQVMEKMTLKPEKPNKAPL